MNKSLIERVAEAGKTLQEVAQILHKGVESQRTTFSREVEAKDVERVISYLRKAASRDSSCITFEQKRSVQRRYWVGGEHDYVAKGPVTLSVHVTYEPSEEQDENLLRFSGSDSE